MKLISIKKQKKESYDGLEVMTDPGIHEEVAEEIKRLLPKGEKILDFGCGKGSFALRLSYLGYEVKAVDVNKPVNEIKNVSFIKITPDSSISDVIGYSSVKAIVAIEVIEHVYSTYRLLKDFYDTLEPGGFLFLTTPNIASFYSRIVFFKEGTFYHFQGPSSWKNGHINPVPFFVLEQFAQDIGYTQINRKCIGSLPLMPLYGWNWKTPLKIIPRILFYFLMGGPGPKEGNCLFYCLQKPKETHGL